jgi:alkylation response protein AidB-like acyl-CoA dehydrogenase
MHAHDDDLIRFRQEVSDWIVANKPLKPDFILPDSFMEVGTDQQFAFLKDWQQKVYEAGYLGMSWPAVYGGRGKPQIYQDIADEEMARHRAPFMVNTIGLNWAGPLILHSGTEQQKQRYVKKILTCEEIWAQGFSEPDHGSDLSNVQLKAVRDGDDYVLNGSKIWTSLGTYAKHMILLARTSPDKNSRYAGLSFFLAPMDIEGIEVVPIQKMTGEYGFAQTFFTDARIPASCMMGNEGEGWMVAMMTLQFERGAEGGQAGGLMICELEVADVIDMAKKAMRAGKPAIEDPFIRDQIVQHLMEERALELNAIRAEIPALVSERPMAIPMSHKLTAGEFRRRLCQFALSLQGANAVRYMGDKHAIDEGYWQRLYLNAFSGTIGGGTSEIQRNILGERILGLPKG